jgi:solute carrier family 25 iron transporter 28/37
MSDFDEEWEEWDGKSPFWVHCVAGSLAGVAEHTLVYPLDTVRTHIQVCATCHLNPKASANANATTTLAASKAASSSSSALRGSVLQKGGAVQVGLQQLQRPPFGMWQTMRHLMSQPVAFTPGSATTAALNAAPQTVGISRLWRGVQTILVGCIPAHALYFSAYEMVKTATLDPATGQVTTYGSALAGASAVLAHDMILAPLDTVKQRLQLGHYRGLTHAMQTMIQSEGTISLYRSFPVTLATNIPYGMVMVGTNEFLKQQWTAEGDKLSLGVTLGASSIAGFMAAASTTPLDRIKTYLQTQQLTPACSITNATRPPDSCPLAAANAGNNKKLVVANWQQAAVRIYQTEGMIGFFRGMAPRLLSHTPAVAISWTTYETLKQYLTQIEW